MKKYKISYYYLATGMEGIPQVHMERIIEAYSKELAAYIYLLNSFGSFTSISFDEYLMKEDWEKYWGLTIKELI